MNVLRKIFLNFCKAKCKGVKTEFFLWDVEELTIIGLKTVQKYKGSVHWKI